ncbi:MAG TPA: thiamine pyrophosphate-binding protein [Malonomonas sp.]
MTMSIFPPAIEARPAHQSDLADMVVESLESIGVEYIFGVPGGAIEPLYNALARSSRRGGLRPIVARHESGAAFMADGYARETGKLGVCCSTTGPGATNLMTGVASAYTENTPLLVITAQTALHLFGKHTLQESSCTAINTVAMFQSCTRYSSLVSHRGQLEGKLAAAIAATQGVPSGPAHLSIPMDVLNSPRRTRSKSLYRFDSLFRPHALLDTEALHELLEELLQARRIVLLLGDGCGKAIDKIHEFAELVHAPIISGPSGKRWINHQHPLYRGVLGYASHRSARETLQDERNDLVLAVGTRFSEMIFSGFENNEELAGKIIHIDENLENLANSHWARLQVCGTIRNIFQFLLEGLLAKKNEGTHCLPLKPVAVSLRGDSSAADFPHSQIQLNDPAACVSDALPLKPQRLMRELSKKMPVDARVFVDAGNSWAWATHYLHMRSSGLYRVGMGFGAMAWAIGASVGSALGSPGSPTFCITGDGSFLMSGQEITVAVVEKLPVIFVILNDSALGMVMHGQRMGGAEQIGFELPPINFAQVARGMGAAAETICTIEELTTLDFAEICRREGPTLLDVYIDPEEVPPMGARMKTLGRSQ